MRSEATGTLSVSFASAPDGVPLSGGSSFQRTLDFGAVSATQNSPALNVKLTRRSAGFVVATPFGLGIQDSAQRVSNATVLAAIAAPDPFFTFRLDGFQLSPTPQMIQGRAKVGVTAPHLLEIEVPSSVTEQNSQLHNAIIFQVIAN